MKTVYADVVLLINFSVDYTLLFLSASFWKIKCSILRMIFASALGSIFALVMNMLLLPQALKSLLAFLFLPIISRVCIGKRSIKTFVKMNVSMLLFSFLLSGITILVDLSVFSHTGINGIPAWILIVSSLCLLASSKCLGNAFMTEVSSRQVSVTVSGFLTKNELLMFSDSGNRLVDPYVRLPVIIVKQSKMKDLLCDSDKIRLIPVKTAIGTSLAQAYTPDSVCIKIKDKEYAVKAVLGFVNDENISVGECDGIIPEGLLTCIEER